ncbi:hypothetical protein DICPUDRAFT_80790 [Dictyostelium purpureum]|uniref:N-acetyltransferase domain-containing protein n=1 Tax=Dictyostelium purpureum TaxID=5786 RepID=F0ZRJ4_DICPU|nr:uncharacterized protein DICPUDRAFT_80790 [Dictyostelium purpureum]EGC33429.1 hypothetical protein DICPUDRAFT_80790 [Dictyostelium purpureum]|eukprot:XP_003290048.1 hypothetical protein DICPUDRAFT_80790 [Dictyostelium purpureum]
MIGVNEEVDIVYDIIPGKLINDDFLNKCSNLFSNHYGTWSKETKSTHQKPGEHCKMTVNEIKEQLLFDRNHTMVVTALNKDNEMIGSCYSYNYTCQSVGCVKLITQIVVNENYRNHNIAQNMILYSIGTEWNAAGIVSPHPYSILALEKITHKKCDPNTISKHAKDLTTTCQVPFVKNHLNQLQCSNNKSMINTEFYVDHSQVLKDLDNQKDWKLGKLEEGCEYFAFVFNDKTKSEC